MQFKIFDTKKKEYLRTSQTEFYAVGEAPFAAGPEIIKIVIVPGLSSGWITKCRIITEGGRYIVEYEDLIK